MCVCLYVYATTRTVICNASSGARAHVALQLRRLSLRFVDDFGREARQLSNVNTKAFIARSLFHFVLLHATTQNTHTGMRRNANESKGASKQGMTNAPAELASFPLCER